jgi:hypothetical protein
MVLDIMSSASGEKDSKVLLQAAALQLQFYLKKKERRSHIEDDALDEIFRKLQKENDEQR